jgi:hypothetical protein
MLCGMQREPLVQIAAVVSDAEQRVLLNTSNLRS